MLLIVLCVLAAVAVHRIWHYEDIFAYPRQWVFTDPLLTPLLIAPGVAVVTLLPFAEIILAVFACYPFLRGAVWVYKRYDPQPVPCTACEKARIQIEDLQKFLRGWKKRVILINADAHEINRLAKAHVDWLFIVQIKKTKKYENIMYRPFQTNPISFTGDLMMAILNGGNATLVTYHCIHTPLWLQVTKSIGTLMGTSWVHVTDAGHLLSLPTHHRCVAPGESVDTVIEEVKPPVHP